MPLEHFKSMKLYEEIYYMIEHVEIYNIYMHIERRT